MYWSRCWHQYFIKDVIAGLYWLRDTVDDYRIIITIRRTYLELLIIGVKTWLLKIHLKTEIDSGNELSENPYWKIGITDAIIMQTYLHLINKYNKIQN